MRPPGSRARPNLSIVTPQTDKTGRGLPSTHSRHSFGQLMIASFFSYFLLRFVCGHGDASSERSLVSILPCLSGFSTAPEGTGYICTRPRAAELDEWAPGQCSSSAFSSATQRLSGSRMAGAEIPVDGDDDYIGHSLSSSLFY